MPQVCPLAEDDDKNASYDALALHMTVNTFDFGAQLVFFLTAVFRGEYAAPHYVVATARRVLSARFDPEKHASPSSAEDDGISHERHQLLFDLKTGKKGNLCWTYLFEQKVSVHRAPFT
jgi:hypothetical protein